MTEETEPGAQNVETLIDRALANGDERDQIYRGLAAPGRAGPVADLPCGCRPSPRHNAALLTGSARSLGCHPTELSTPQNNRARAAAFSRRWRSRSLRYSSNAARSAAVTEAWVGTTHAVGQRVTPFVRMYSSMTVSQLASEIISIDVSLRT